MAIRQSPLFVLFALLILLIIPAIASGAMPPPEPITGRSLLATPDQGAYAAGERIAFTLRATGNGFPIALIKGHTLLVYWGRGSDRELCPICSFDASRSAEGVYHIEIDSPARYIAGPNQFCVYYDSDFHPYDDRPKVFSCFSVQGGAAGAAALPYGGGQAQDIPGFSIAPAIAALCIIGALARRPR
jgi:hypothetical protein